MQIHASQWVHSVHRTKLEIWAEKAVPIWDRGKKISFKATPTIKEASFDLVQ